MMNQIIIMEMTHHILIIATSYEIKKIMTFFILRGTCTVIQAYSFVMFFGIDYDEK